LAKKTSIYIYKEKEEREYEVNMSQTENLYVSRKIVYKVICGLIWLKQLIPFIRDYVQIY